MKPLTVCIQVSAVVVVLVLSFYLGRPIYYESLVKSQEAGSQSTTGLLSSKPKLIILQPRHGWAGDDYFEFRLQILRFSSRSELSKLYSA